MTRVQVHGDPLDRSRFPVDPWRLVERWHDPRDLGVPCPEVKPPARPSVNTAMLVPPLPEEEARQVRLEKTVNIDSIPEMDTIPDELELPVLLKVGDDISTDDLVPAGTRVMPFWSNIERVGDFVFETVDESYPRRAREARPNRASRVPHFSST